MHQKLIVPIAAVAIMLTSVSAALAQSPSGDRAFGKVTVIDAKTGKITVQGRDSTLTTFAVNGGTKYMVPVDLKSDDIKVGDKVMVMGQPSEDDDTVIEARMVQVIPADMPAMPFGGGRRGGGGAGSASAGGGANAGGGGGANAGGGGFRRFMTMGTIATLTPTITVTTSDGTTKTVDATPDTHYGSMKAGTLADITVGKNVMAQLSNNVATSVFVRNGGGWGGRGGGGGWRRQGGDQGGGGGAPGGGGGGGG